MARGQADRRVGWRLLSSRWHRPRGGDRVTDRPRAVARLQPRLHAGRGARLREDVTYHYCHPTTKDLSRRVAAFETRLNQDVYAVADRLKDRLDPDEEKLRFSI